MGKSVRNQIKGLLRRQKKEYTFEREKSLERLIQEHGAPRGVPYLAKYGPPSVKNAPKKPKSNVVKFKPKSGFTEAGAKEFYKSWDWHDLRYKVLLKHGRRCMCCGASPDTGAVMNVDHIKPIRLHWELRLEFDNLQVLCSPCNRGKSFRDQTDFRETQEPENELDREYKAILKD